MVYLFLADGFETIEALTVVDMLRRARIDIQTVSMNETKTVTSSHKIAVEADVLLADVEQQPADMYVLPGGIPGTPNLRANETLMNMITKQYEAGGYIAAICAAPGIFSELGFLRGRRATCYPSFEEQLVSEGAELTGAPAVTDGNVITGRGMGCSIAFASEIITALDSAETAQRIKDAIVYEEK
jgi:4-methyl-5(b-hydroxyethyl)-thiazole monophosphate biosynthesis